MSRLHTSFVLGYHGCERSVAEQVLSGRKTLEPSEHKYDWLGHGVYFWESDPKRAEEWAVDVKKCKVPFVLGAVIDLGECLDLLARENIRLVRVAHRDLMDLLEILGMDVPKNHLGNDKIRRELDCAVINHLQSMGQRKDSIGVPFNGFDTVRGLFSEGAEIYDGAGFREKTHVQIAVRNQACIKGFFRG